VLLASMTDVGQRKVLAVRRGLRSLLRRTRSRQGRRGTTPLCCCAVIAALLLPVAAWAQPKPDPPPPGVHKSEPTRLDPDRRPARTSRVPPAPPAPVQEPAAPPVQEPVQQTVVRVVETPQRQTSPPAPPRTGPKRARPVGRLFAAEVKLPRRPPDAIASVERVSSDTDSRSYLVAALSLGVLALGSATLLSVLARLRHTRHGLV
jgi:hypothetical protein